MPALALGGVVGSLALATPAAADPAEDASTKANIKPLALDQIPADGSNPSADKTIWIDFAGGTLTKTSWTEVTGVANLKYEPADRLTADQKLNVYQQIVQAYSPFDVNITTKKPSAAQLERTSMSDDEYGGIVHVTDSDTDSPGFEKIFEDQFAGKAPLNGFGDAYEQHAIVTTDVFPQVPPANLPLVEAYRGEEVGATAVHEIGHLVGAEHHGWKKGNENFEYYSPGGWNADTASVWGPIMGSPTTGMRRWSDGFPNGSNNNQDDLAVITKNLSKKDAEQRRLFDGNLRWTDGYCYYPDNPDKGYFKGKVDANGKCDEDEPLKMEYDYAGRPDYRSSKESHSDSRARVLNIQDGKASLYGEFVRNLGSGAGNWYVFDAAAGPVNLTVTPQQPYSMLDLKVTLYDANLKEIASANPALKNVQDSNQVVIPGQLEGQDAAIQQNGAVAQTYYVKVEQASFGDMDSITSKQAKASPKYGNLGVYEIAVQGGATNALAAPTVDPTYGDVVAGTGVPGATVDVDNENGKLIGSAKVGPDGKYSVKLDPAAEVGDELLVSQSQEGLKSRPVAVTVVAEEKPEVKVKVDPTKITKGDDGGVTVIGTGFESGQKVTGVVNSDPVELGVKVADEKGSVEFVFDAAKLEVGKHKVTLTAVDDKDYTGSAKLTVVKATDDGDDDDKPSPSPSPDDDDPSTPSPDPDDDGETPPPAEDDGDDGLPGTGASNVLTLFGIGGLVLIGSGATIAVAARRRNRG